MAITGTTCWGHSTGVTQTNTRTFNANWTGTGTIASTGDTEAIYVDAGEYMESEIVETGSVTVTLATNQYRSGDSVTVKYKTAATEGGISGASWTAYSTPFASSGFAQVRVEAAASETIYYSQGSDNYPNNYSYNNTTTAGDNITCTAGGTVKKIGVKLNSVSADDIKIALYYDVGGTWTLKATKTIANASLVTGWNDATLSGAEQYTCGAGEAVLVMALPMTSQAINYATGTGYYATGQTYSSFGPATIAPSTDWAIAVRITC